MRIWTPNLCHAPPVTPQPAQFEEHRSAEPGLGAGGRAQVLPMCRFWRTARGKLKNRRGGGGMGGQMACLGEVELLSKRWYGSNGLCFQCCFFFAPPPPSNETESLGGVPQSVPLKPLKTWPASTQQKTQLFVWFWGEASPKRVRGFHKKPAHCKFPYREAGTFACVLKQIKRPWVGGGGGTRPHGVQMRILNPLR